MAEQVLAQRSTYPRPVFFAAALGCTAGAMVPACVAVVGFSDSHLRAMGLAEAIFAAVIATMACTFWLLVWLTRSRPGADGG